MSGFRRGLMANALDPLKVPLTFTAAEAGATVALTATGSPTVSGLHYRMGKSGVWMPYTAGTVIALPNIGDSVQFWNSENTLSTNATNRVQAVITGKTAASGNIQSMLNWNETLLGIWSVYNHMFMDNTDLVSAPLLPATAVYGYCYTNMFITTGITKAPELPATTLASYCYYRMLNQCTNLKEIRVHFTSWHENATDQWVGGVPAGGTFYKPSALPEEYGVNRIPEGWTVVNID